VSDSGEDRSQPLLGTGSGFGHSVLECWFGRQDVGAPAPGAGNDGLGSHSRATIGERIADRERGIEDTDAHRGVRLGIEVHDERAPVSIPGSAGQAKGDGCLSDPALHGQHGNGGHVRTLRVEGEQPDQTVSSAAT
jgi:hypothetical protein